MIMNFLFDTSCFFQQHLIALYYPSAGVSFLKNHTVKKLQVQRIAVQ